MTNLVGTSAVGSTPGVSGDNSALGVGVYGSSNGTGSAGVQGQTTCATGSGSGVYGNSTAPSGAGGLFDGQSYGVQGRAYGSTFAQGIRGEAHGTSGQIGVYGTTTASGGIGVYGTSTNGYGVYGNSINSTAVYGLGYVGVYGQGMSSHSIYGYQTNNLYYAGYFYGNGYFSGYLSKAGGGFIIDHPQPEKSDTHFLNHCFVESPDMKNVYDGVADLDANGEVVITMPSYFEAANEDFRYQLTALGAAMPDLHISSEIKDCAFKISGGKASKKVSWQITGIRADKWAKANHPGVEIEKSKEEKGHFMHPELFGHDESKSINSIRSPKCDNGVK